MARMRAKQNERKKEQKGEEDALEAKTERTALLLNGVCIGTQIHQTRLLTALKLRRARLRCGRRGVPLLLEAVFSLVTSGL